MSIAATDPNGTSSPMTSTHCHVTHDGRDASGAVTLDGASVVTTPFLVTLAGLVGNGLQRVGLTAPGDGLGWEAEIISPEVAADGMPTDSGAHVHTVVWECQATGPDHTSS